MLNHADVRDTCMQYYNRGTAGYDWTNIALHEKTPLNADQLVRRLSLFPFTFLTAVASQSHLNFRSLEEATVSVLVYKMSTPILTDGTGPHTPPPKHRTIVLSQIAAEIIKVS